MVERRIAQLRREMQQDSALSDGTRSELLALSHSDRHRLLVELAKKVHLVVGKPESMTPQQHLEALEHGLRLWNNQRRINGLM